jgi:hypothetical protein
MHVAEIDDSAWGSFGSNPAPDNFQNGSHAARRLPANV